MTDPIDYTADRVARWIKAANPEETDDVDRMSPTLSLLFNHILTTLSILLAGYWTGRLLPTVITLSVFAVCRIVLKGFHLKSMTWCVLVTTAMIWTISAIPVSGTPMILLTPLCVLAVFMKSPAFFAHKLLFSGLMLVNMWFLLPSVFLGYAAYTLTLLPYRK